MTEPISDGRAPVEEANPLDARSESSETVEEGVEPTAPAATRARKRGRETARDMVWSLAVVAIFVVFLVAVTYRAKPDPVHVVDPATSVETAQALAPFQVVVPVGLPTTWRATSARYEPAASSSVPNAALWHVGYVTPAGAYASLDQASGEPSVLLGALVEGAHVEGPGTGPFAGWQHWVTDSGDRQAYVLTGSASTVVVYGTAAVEELATLEGSLVPDPETAVSTKGTPRATS